MPSFSKLPELQRWQIVLYIRTLVHNPETKLKPCAMSTRFCVTALAEQLSVSGYRRFLPSHFCSDSHSIERAIDKEERD